MTGITSLALTLVYKPGITLQRKPVAPARESDGVYVPRATQSINKKWVLYRLLKYVWLVPGGLLFCFYFKTTPPHQTAAYWFAGINVFVFVIFLTISAYFSGLRRYIPEPFFTTSSGEYRRGGKIKISIRQGFKKPFHLNKIEVGFTCEQTTTIALRFKEGRPRRVLLQKWQTLANSRPVDIGDLLHFKAEFDIPAGLPATTLPKASAAKTIDFSISGLYISFFEKDIAVIADQQYR